MRKLVNDRFTAIPHIRSTVIVSAIIIAAIAVAGGAWALVSSRSPSPARGAKPPTASSGAALRGQALPAQRADRADPASRGHHRAALTAKKKKKARSRKRGYRVVRTGTCPASFYSEGQTTASGERFDPGALTAAHKSLPLGSKVRVTNRANGRSVIVRINDRGPYVGDRCLDLSSAAMSAVGGTGSGVIMARYEVLARG